MALAIAITDQEFTSSKLHLFGTITPTGTYPTTGDTLSFAGLDQIKSGQVPTYVRIWSARPTSSAQTNLFVYNYVPGTTQANGKMQVFTGAAAQTALTEFSTASYPAGVTADTIQFEAVFSKLV
jgi:hypothetical protein